MANTDKDILITPNRGSSNEPKIEFKGASSTVGPSTITATIYPTNNGTLSFDGTEGSLFSIANNLTTGSIFSVNPISGIPIIDVNADRTIALNPYGGNTGIGLTNPSYKLDVNGTFRVTGSTSITGNMTAWNATTPGRGVGGLHLGAASGTSNAGPAITFGARDSDSGTTGQAGIYINSDGTYGTKMYFATTDSYATGSKVAMSIDHLGAVSINRSSLTVSGSVSAAGASGFYSTTYASNVRNPIWRFANADGYGFSYFQGSSGVGGDTLGFHFGTATAAASLLQLNGGTGIAVNGTTDNISANESGTSNYWRARILSKNSGADKSAFLGVYASSPGVFAHNHALNAWATLYVNTTNGSSDGGNVTIAGSSNVGIGILVPTTKLDVIGNSRIGGAATRSTSGLTVGYTNNTTFAANTDIGDGLRTLSLINESSTTNVMAALGFRVNPNGGNANAMLDMKFVQTGATNTSSLYYSFNHGGSFKDRFLFKSDGTFGVGTVIREVPYDTLNNGTLSWEGSAGQLFSITNNLTSGSIFSVNDVSGIPSIDVDANGTIQLAPYNGNVGVGTLAPAAKLDVNGTARIDGISVGRGSGNVATNTAVGYQSIYSNPSGSYNTAIGYQTLYSNTTGEYNTANGAQALTANITGGQNTATGVGALRTNTTGYYNTSNGSFALYSNTTGEYNTATGDSALLSNTDGNNNTATGAGALYSNTDGIANTANGSFALYYNTTGVYNTATGQGSLGKNTIGYENTANGRNALYYNVTGSQNTANGVRALYDNTSNYNSAFGAFALRNVTIGSNNTAVGWYAGTDAVANITTQSNYVVLGNNSTTNANIKVAWTVTSDARDKTNIGDVELGLDFVSQLRPVKYQYRKSRHNPEPQIGARFRYGFLAQDILPLEGNEPIIIDDSDETNLKYNESCLIPILVNAIKELKQRLDAAGIS